ncbi:hypothetical protein COLO4_16428 [Corchorus olitorius]|uniref:Uncharacterized protein n=1 Tax=Corchorus olitorius TaxID=93759 RepID=A0A1R3JHF8_9ROSI|nr:hypothetical protein COLO4_16428 [Corchorus olitorius]
MGEGSGQDNFGQLDWFDIALTTSWAVWGARNKEVHDNVRQNPQETAAFIRSYLVEFQRCKKFNSATDRSERRALETAS